MGTAEAREIRIEAAKKKARDLRWKKPLVKELNLEEIRANLGEMNDSCGNVTWYMGRETEELEDLLGEDDANEFKGSFYSLSVEIERAQEDLDDIWVPEYFDDFMAAVRPKGEALMGYDSYEEDYFPLTSWEAEYACREAGERLQRKTKKEIIDCAHTVIGIICQYMAIKYRFDSLSSAFDVLMDRSEKQLRAVKEIEEAYAAAEAGGFNKWTEAGRKLDRLLRDLPDRYWVE